MALTREEELRIAELRAKAAADYNSLLEDEKALLRELQDKEQERENTAEGRINASIRQITLLEQQIKLNETLRDLGETTVGAYADTLKQEQQLLDLKRQQLTLDRASGEIDEDEYKRLLKKNAEEQSSLRANKQGYNDSENFAKRFMGITREPTSEFGKFLVDPGARLEGLVSGLGETIDGMSILTSTVDKVVEATIALAYEQDGAVANFRKATGASGEFDDNIRGLERSLFTAGVGATEAGQAVQSLFLNVTDFTEMSEKQQETLGKTVAVLNELGVATEATAKNMQFAIKVMGKNADQAAELQRELFTFAQDLGVSGAKMAEDFAAMGPQIAALGTKGVDAFRQLEVQAKNTGLALTEILGVVEKFDKFDSAADSVSRLNALLGGPYLNALELVAETDPSKRFEILKDRIDDAGLSFDTMDYYQRKAIASAMGLNEQQLALMMRGKLDLIQEPAKSAEDIEKLAIQTAQFNTVMEEFTQLAKGLAISFGPLVSMLKDFVQTMQIWGKATPVVVAGFGAVTYAILVYKGAIEGVTWATIRHGRAEMTTVMFGVASLALLLAGLAYFGGAAGKVAAAIGVIAAAVWALSAAEKTSVIIGAIGIIAAGISYLANGIVNGFSTPLPVALGMITTAVLAMGLAFLAFGPMLLPVIALISGAAVAFGGFATVFASILDEAMITNLKLIAIEIANIVDKINELSTEKAIKLAASTSVTAESAALIKNLDTATLDKISTITTANTVATTNINQTNAAAAAGAGMPTGFEGPPPTINVNLSIDGKEFATTVNSVDVSKYIGGKSSNLYNSIVDMIGQGINTGKGAP